MGARRMSLTAKELGVLCEALREALAAELLSPTSVASARELIDRIDAKLPSATDRHPAGAAAGRVMAGDEILRLLLACEDRHGYAALTNEQIACELDWKPAGTSVRELLEELRRTGWLRRGGGSAGRTHELTRKGRGRARALQGAGQTPDVEAVVTGADELLDLIYADSTPCSFRYGGEREDRLPGVWHRPTVQAAARLSDTKLAALETALRADGLIGEQIHSYGRLTEAGEDRARERWRESHPRAYGGPPRLSRPPRWAKEVVVPAEDRACPNCRTPASWLTRRSTKRWEELRGRGEAGHTCAHCDVRWTIYLEPTDRTGRYDPLADPTVCRPRWRYRGGWRYDDQLAPPDHHPPLARREAR